MKINFGHERFYNEHGHRFVRPISPWVRLGQEWRKALVNPYYILAWQVLLVVIIYGS